MTDVYRLKIAQVEQVCFFELTWGKGRQLAAKLSYPQQLILLYQRWQHIYLNYYQSALRGRAIASGALTATTDWHGQLVQAEAKLLYEFHQWLRSGELFDIRSELGRKAAEQRSPHRSNSQADNSVGLDLLITCDPISLGRLPWESWEIGAEFGATWPIRIARLPVNVRAATSYLERPYAAARILVVIGDDTGLDFAAEQAAIATLKRLATLKIVGWQSGMDADELKRTICDTIQASPGWDMLLFFGHSNEANAVGGQIAIAPNTTLSIRELSPYLRKASARGLKFALFNSCQGLDIATSLIDLGLNQVAVMREPIHNRVAQVFFLQFVQSLSQFDDVHTALQKASQALRTESNLTYPSAHLVPSLFRHRESVLFRLRPVGWRSQVRSLLPTARWQTAGLALLAALSLLAPVTQTLLSYRLWTQAIYRDLTTRSVPAGSPPVLLVQIDERSIRAGIPSGNPYPMNRDYLAQIIDRLSALNAQTVGMDYLLDRPQVENDRRFAQSVRESATGGMTIVFSAILEGDAEVGASAGLASENWTMQGYTNMPRWYLRSLPDGDDCLAQCPFSYLLAIAQTTRQTPIATAAVPNLESDSSFRRTLLATIKDQNQSPVLKQLYQLRLSPWASLSRWWNQRWLHPPLDFSLPPEQIYSRLSAYQLLTLPVEQLARQFDWQQQVVIVASGGYGEAGTGKVKDFSDPPRAIAYWYRQQTNTPEQFTGGEANAYALHHFLQQHYILPIPDIWSVGIALITGAGIVLIFRRCQLDRQRRWLVLVAIGSSYGWLALHLYLTAQILLPWLLPVATVWIFCYPSLTAPARQTARSQGA